MPMASNLPEIQIPQEAVYVSPGSNIILKATWNQSNIPGLVVTWMRCINNSFTKLDIRGTKYHACSCHGNTDTFELTIYEIESSDEGVYRVDVKLPSFTLESKLINLYVLKDVSAIGKEELNFLRYRECDSIARDALQILLERYLQQSNIDLATHLTNNKFLLISKAKLSPDQKNDLYPRNGSLVFLKNLDVSILYKLLRNTTNIQTPKNNWNTAPTLESIGEGDDVERIHQYRNFIAHKQSIKKLPDEDFEERWFDLTMAIDRLSRGTLRKRLCQLRYRKFEHGKVPKRKCDTKESVKDPQSEIISKWRLNDKLYCEDLRSFQKAFKLIKEENMVVIIGGSGSGKTATARHCALKLANKEWKVIPIEDIREINNTSTEEKCVFVFDDPVGNLGLDERKISDLEQNRSDVLQFFSGENHKLIVTCQKIIYNEAKRYHVFDNYTIVDIEDKDCALNISEKTKLLQAYGVEDLVDLSSLETTATCMFPLYCSVLFRNKEGSSESESPPKNLNPRDFLLTQLDIMAISEKTRIQYASLVLLVITKNKFTDAVFNDKDLLTDIFDKCKVHGKLPSRTQILEKLEHLENTYVVRKEFGFKFLHDSFFEIVAFHFGQEKANQSLILQRLDVDYIANNTYIESSDYSARDLQIKITPENYKKLCRRLYIFLQEMIHVKQSSTFVDLIFSHNCWSSEDFLKIMFEAIGEKEVVELFSKSYKVSKVKPTARTQRKISPWLQKQDLLENQNFGPCEVSDDGKIKLIDWIVCKGHLRFLQNVISKSSGWFNWLRFSSPVIHPERLFWLSIYSMDKHMFEFALSQMKDVQLEEHINTTFDSVQTPLTLACLLNAFEIVQILVEKGASISKCNSNGESPVFLAVKNGSKEIICFLLKKSPLINDKIDEQVSPFKVARESESEEILKILLQNCDHTSTAHDGKTPLHLAIKYGFHDDAEKLINGGAEINAIDRKKQTPLHIACKKGNGKMVQKLINCCADLVNAIDKKKQTPLHIACRKGNGKIVEALVAVCDTSIKDNMERLPLHIACKNGKLALVKLLYDPQYLYIKDKIGKTPRNYARQCADDKVWKYLYRKEKFR